MDLSGDELAGVVDLFGALTRTELCEACVELAHKAGEDREPAAFEADVQRAVDTYHLLAVADEEGDRDLLVPGPAAFPTLPDGATDLLHILDAPEREADTERVATAAERRFRADAAAAVEADDREAIRRLLDVSYELDSWGVVDLAATRERLDSALDGS